MISPRWRKIINEIKAYRARTVIVVMSITIGVFALGTMVCLREILGADMNRNWQAIHAANITIYTEPFKEDLVQTVLKMPGVAEAEGKKKLSARVRKGDQWKSIDIHLYPDSLADTKINKIKPLEGSWPPTPNAVFLERSCKSYLGVKTGDTLQLELPEGRKKNLVVAGFVHDPGKMSPAVGQVINGYIGSDTLGAFDANRQFDILAVRLAGNPGDDTIKEMTRKIRNKLELGGMSVFFSETNRSDQHPAKKFVDSLMKITGALGLGALLLSGFLLFNTISAVLVQQVRQIGIMKAVGASRGQIIQIYTVFVLCHSVMALLLAVPLGGVMANLFAVMVAGNFNFDRSGFALPPQAVLLQVVVGLGVPLLASCYPIWSGTRVTVREAISSYGIDGSETRGLANRLLESVKKLPRPVLLSLRNTFRRKGRMALTMAALTMGGAILITVLSVNNSLILTTDDALRYFNYDVQATFNQYYRVEKLQQVGLSIPGVKSVESWGFGRVRLLNADGSEKDDSEQVTLMAPPADTKMLIPTVIEGRWLLDDDENGIVVNSEVIQNNPGMKTGDWITLKINNLKTRWKVVGVVRGVLTGPMMYANYPYYSRVTHTSGQAASLQVLADGADPGVEAAIAGEMEQRFKQAGIKTGQVTKTSDIRRQVKSGFSTLVSFLLAMAALMGLVGGLGLMGTMGMNVVERTREIGVMRAIGASNRMVMQIFIVEGVVIGLISWVLGSLLSLIISKPLCDGVGKMLLNAKLSYSFSLGGVYIWLLVVVFVSALASYIPARNATRVRVRDVLAYE